MPLIHYSCSIFLLTVSSWLPVVWICFPCYFEQKELNVFKTRVLLSSLPRGEGEGGSSYWATLPWPIKSLWPVDLKSCFCSQMAGVRSMTSGHAAFSWEKQLSAQTPLGRSCLPQYPASTALAIALLWRKAALYVSSAAVTIVWKCARCAILFLQSDLCGKAIVLL